MLFFGGFVVKYCLAVKFSVAREPFFVYNLFSTFFHRAVACCRGVKLLLIRRSRLAIHRKPEEVLHLPHISFSVRAPAKENIYIKKIIIFANIMIANR